MSPEDELLPLHRWPPVDSAFATRLAEFWDDTESDQRNIEIIHWWLSMNPDNPHTDPR